LQAVHATGRSLSLQIQPLEVRAASEVDGAFDMIIRERADGPRKRTCDWRGGHAGGYLLQHSAKKRIFVTAITSLAQRRR
jgi:hypothetical protein